MTGPEAKLIALAAAALLSGGCGLKGPLYLPDRPPQAASPSNEAQEAPRGRRTAPRPATESQEEEAAQTEETPPGSMGDPERAAKSESSAAPPDF
ncbi:MAG TPA: hypothetical protein VHK24_02460 [Steroidobacter sp.]|jgi:predicted small lipoprotein YifL|nr:hypothetical protein [Steroidobacter sp.]